MLRLLFLTHRYLGIGLSLIMLLWCLSGFIMMYKPYPELNYQEQLQTLSPLNLVDCCDNLTHADLMDTDFQVFQIMMLQGEPVIHLYTPYGSLSTVLLKSARPFNGVNEQNALQIAELYRIKNGYPNAELIDTIYNDQWTVYGAYNRHRPLYKFAANDVADTQWYISSKTGEIIQHTTGDQRLWGYLGAVIHWLYPTILREKVQLWSQVVIWLTVLGLFLTLTGIYFGLKQYKTRKNGKHSPYKGLSLWHHYTGLIFGILTLSWVVSGLFSMQPFGLLEGSSAGPEAIRLSGGSITLEAINNVVSKIDELALTEDTVLIQGQNLDGELFLYTVTDQAETKRFNPGTLQANPLTESELRQLAELMLPETKIKNAALLYEEDNYYFSHHDLVKLPVYKIATADAENTIYYMDPDNAELLGKYGSESRWYRWLHYGLHRLDFTPLMRSRPIWDILMWSLMGGTTLGIFTGFFLGIRRIYRSI